MGESLLAGIFGGPGNHVIQIVIVALVVVGLIAYAAARAMGPAGGKGRVPAADAGDMDDGSERSATGDGCVRLMRTWGGIGIGGQGEQLDIAIDGIVVGSIANKETVEVSVAPGHHTLRLGSGRRRSVERSFNVGHGDVVVFSCHGPRFWPVAAAALIKPGLWISLRRE